MATLEINERVIFDDEFVMINDDVTFFLKRGNVIPRDTLHKGQHTFSIGYTRSKFSMHENH